MAVRPYTIVIAFIAGAAIAVMTYPALRGLAGLGAPAAVVAQRNSKAAEREGKPAVLAMDVERIKLAQIELQQAGPAENRPAIDRARNHCTGRRARRPCLGQTFRHGRGPAQEHRRRR